MAGFSIAVMTGGELIVIKDLNSVSFSGQDSRVNSISEGSSRLFSTVTCGRDAFSKA